jgi:hypothetical protein
MESGCIWGAGGVEGGGSGFETGAIQGAALLDSNGCHVWRFVGIPCVFCVVFLVAY